MRQFAENRLLQVVLAPVMSEKVTLIGEKYNQVVFRVLKDATKVEIKAAVEFLFKVKVDDVRVLNVEGKVKRSGRFIGRGKSWKKAYISLAEGQSLDLNVEQ